MLRRVLPRVGYAAVGLLYIIVGFLAARIAFLGSRDRISGMQGALRALLSQTEGAWIVGAMAAGLFAFAIWRLMQTFAARPASFLLTAGWFVAAGGYGVLAGTAVGGGPRGARGVSPHRGGLRVLLA